MPHPSPLGRPALLLGVSLLCLVSVACAPTSKTTTGSTVPVTSGVPATDECADPATVKPGVLTIATDSPAYDPWFTKDDPTNGKGYESAVAYAVADKLGYAKDDVKWAVVSFNQATAPGPKTFDVDINQISINARRAKAVTFSDGYYSAAQAIITLKDSSYAGATSLADFADATLGVQVGTTSLDAIASAISPSKQPQVFDDTNVAKNALQNGQVDGIVVDLPTAFYITAVEIQNSTVVGQFQSDSGRPEQFGLLFEQGNPLVACANQAIATLKSNGTLADIETRWLSQVVDVPTLS